MENCNYRCPSVREVYGRRGLPGDSGSQGSQGSQGLQGPDGPPGPSSAPFIEATMGNVQQSVSYTLNGGLDSISFSPVFTNDVSFNAGSNEFTVLVAGVYRFVVIVTCRGADSQSSDVLVGVQVNGSTMMSVYVTVGSSTSPMVASSLLLKATDVVRFVSYSSVNSGVPLQTGLTSGVSPYPSIYRLTVAYICRVM